VIERYLIEYGVFGICFVLFLRLYIKAQKEILKEKNDHIKDLKETLPLLEKVSEQIERLLNDKGPRNT